MNRLLRLKVIFILIFLWPQLLSAQKNIEIKGCVFDTKGNPISSATVVIRLDTTSIISAFTTTNEKGCYKISTKIYKSITIVVSSIGYERQMTVLNEPDSVTNNLDFYLFDKQVVLNEIILQSKRRITEKNDTITINADAFRDSTERNLAELLAKIPGIRVDKSTGKITVNGSLISKILIEGDDLTDRNYQVLSQNMSAEIVKNIQILNSFSDNALLKGLSESEEKAINITLKNSKKNKITGNLSGSTDFVEKYEFSSDVLNVQTRNFKTFSNLNFNNISYIPYYQENPDLIKPETVKEIISTRYDNILSINNMPKEQLQQLDVFNKSLYSNNYFNLKMSKKTLLKGGITSFNDNQSFFSTVNQSFYINNIIEFQKQDKSIVYKPNTILANLNLECRISDKSQVNYSVNFIKENYQTLNSIIYNNSNEAIKSVLQKKNALLNNIEYTYRINQNNAFIITIVNSRISNKQEFQHDFTSPVFFKPANKDILLIKGMVNQPLNLKSVAFNYYLKKSKLISSLAFGYMQKKENIFSLINSNGFSPGDTLLLDSLSNNTNILYNIFYLTIHSSYKIGNYRITGSLHSGTYSNKVRENIFRIQDENKGFFFTPSAGLNYKKKDQAFDIAFSNKTHLPNSQYQILNPVFSGLETIVNGSNTFNPEISNIIVANHSWNIYKKDFFLYTNILYKKRNKGVSLDNSINLPYLFSRVVRNNILKRILYTTTTLDKYLAALQSRISLSFGYSDIIDNYFINGLLREIVQKEFGSEISIRTSFDGIVNLHLGVKYSTIRTTLKDSISVFQVPQNKLFTFLDLTLRFSKRIQLEFSNEVNKIYRVSLIQKPFYFSNFVGNYDIISGKLKLKLIWRNVYNIEKYQEQFLSGLTKTVNSVKLNSRFFLIQINYSF